MKDIPGLKKKSNPRPLSSTRRVLKKPPTATEEVGFDGGELIKGRKRFVLCDTLGATMAIYAVLANKHDGQTALAWWASVVRQSGASPAVGAG